MKKIKSVLMNDDEFNRTLKRLAHEIIENHSDLDNVVIIGIRTRGEFLARKINNFILEIAKKEIPMGILDVTFYRDDFRTNLGSPQVQSSDIMFPIENKKIILIDDVLYTGRTIRAAMDEIFSFGRPKSISLCVLSDRGHRELPIRPDFVGKNFPTSKSEYIYVHVKEVDNEDAILLVEYEDEKSE
tara:strand:+ start:1451 stop:2008 length:558 start_codon:yes stop_codon:yes gene_type:complete